MQALAYGITSKTMGLHTTPTMSSYPILHFHLAGINRTIEALPWDIHQKLNRQTLEEALEQHRRSYDRGTTLHLAWLERIGNRHFLALRARLIAR